LEEADLEFEQLQDLEQELEGPEFQEDRERETLFGRWLPFLRDLTGKASTAADERKIKRLLASHESLYDIPEVWRGSIYRYWEKQINKDCLEKLKTLLAEYKRIIDNTKVTKVQFNNHLLLLIVLLWIPLTEL
jgi:helicase required for RNAi-mediated heterochromatin assembly 1